MLVYVRVGDSDDYGHDGDTSNSCKDVKRYKKQQYKKKYSLPIKCSIHLICIGQPYIPVV